MAFEFGGISVGLSLEGISVDAFDEPDNVTAAADGMSISFETTLDGIGYSLTAHGSGLGATLTAGVGYSYTGSVTDWSISYTVGGAFAGSLQLPYLTSLQDLSDAAGLGTPLTGNEPPDNPGFRVAPSFGLPGDVTINTHPEFFALILPDNLFGLVYTGSSSGETINTYTTDDNVAAMGGDDTIRLSPGTDLIDGGEGSDTADGRTATAALTFDGGTGMGSYGGNSFTLSAVEALIGSTLADTLRAGGDVTMLFGAAGNDSLTGSTGNDLLSGGSGDDQINAAAGNDTLAGDGGANALNGGPGRDWVDYSDTTGRVLLDFASDVSGAGYARFYQTGASQGDTYNGLENAVGGDFADNLRGNDADNHFMGGGVSDRLYGRRGNDTLDGGAGADALYGNLGADVLTGGSDLGRRDRFIYFQAEESRAGEGNRDIITDFRPGEDRIEIGRIDADITQGNKQEFIFIGSVDFSGTAGELGYRHEGGNTIVQADRDGDGVADFEIELTGMMDVIADDFLL